MSSHENHLNTHKNTKIEVEQVENFKQTLCGCGIDSSRHIPTGNVIETAFVSNMFWELESGM